MGTIRANWLASYLLENHFPPNGMNMLSTRNKSTDVELQPLLKATADKSMHLLTTDYSLPKGGIIKF